MLDLTLKPDETSWKDAPALVATGNPRQTAPGLLQYFALYHNY
jgi:hypothetical protein